MTSPLKVLTCIIQADVLVPTMTCYTVCSPVTVLSAVYSVQFSSRRSICTHVMQFSYSIRVQPELYNTDTVTELHNMSTYAEGGSGSREVAYVLRTLSTQFSYNSSICTQDTQYTVTVATVA